MTMRPPLPFALAVVVVALRAQDPGPLPPFQPPANHSNTLRIWGHPYLSTLVENWERDYRLAHPEIAFETRLLGNGTAMPALYTGLADIALFGRDTNVTDDDGFAHTLGYPHLALEVATGSLDAPGKSPALVVFVHRENPLARLTLAQLDAMFGPELRRGAPAAIRTWGDLGLTGKWRDQPIHLYADDIRSGTGQFFQRVVLKGSAKRNWEHFTESKDTTNLIGAPGENGRQITEALRNDPFGLAVSTLRYANPRVKPLALAESAAGPFCDATRDNLIARTYPLTRAIIAAVNRPPGQPLDPKVRAFLAYVLSADGQQDVERAGGYLPLNRDALQAARQKIE
jgi:phosphate transport system substrate-binding protein